MAAGEALPLRGLWNKRLDVVSLIRSLPINAASPDAYQYKSEQGNKHSAKQQRALQGGKPHKQGTI